MPSFIFDDNTKPEKSIVLFCDRCGHMVATYGKPPDGMTEHYTYCARCKRITALGNYGWCMCSDRTPTGERHCNRISYDVLTVDGHVKATCRKHYKLNGGK